MVISYNGLVEICEKGILEGANFANINGSSIDVTLGPDLLVETFPPFKCPNCGWDVTSEKYSKNVLWNSYMTGEYIHCINCIRSSNAREWIKPVDFAAKESITFKKVSCENGYILEPGECCLAHTVEKFNLPMDITAEFRLKSSMARIFLEQLHAVWCDPGWNNSVLTLEFVNMTKYHPLILRAGDKCGQATFYRHEEVPVDRSYAVRGQYNNQVTATETKGVK